MKVLIVGASGQVGRALSNSAPAEAEVTCFARRELDITNGEAVTAAVLRTEPDIVFNAAAYTAVDRAESEPAAAEAINAHAVRLLSSAAQSIGAQFVHLSTDFVFDGCSSVPYSPTAATNPLNVYGRTKLAGEKEAGIDALVVRTSWVYGAGGSNFVSTMLRLMRQGSPLRVVDDQVGTPTYAASLSGALWKLALKRTTGTYHFTDSGVASWYDFAVAIREEGMALEVLKDPGGVSPIASKDFPNRGKATIVLGFGEERDIGAAGNDATALAREPPRDDQGIKSKWLISL